MMRFLTMAALAMFIAGHLDTAHSLDESAHKHGTHSECPLPKTAMDVVKCAVNEHPMAKRANMATEYSTSLTDVARQIPNPELDIGSTFGRNSTSGGSNTDVAILQPIEWGGKRSARIKTAEAQIDVSKAESVDVAADVVRETVRNLFRLRQLDLEKTILESTIATLERTISQQSSKPALAPEQQVALSVYRMAVADTRLRRSELFEEERKIEHYFHVSTGHSLAELRTILPKSPERWPTLSSESGPDGKSPALAKALADRSLSLAELSSARANTWPILKLGPMAKLDRSNTQNNEQFGFRLMMDLPVLNWNGGNRLHANAGVSRSERLIDLTRKEESHERSEQLKVYTSAVEALNSAPSISTIDKDFSKNQALASRGLVSGPLLIEFHRQRSDLIKSRNARELRAIEALWLIYKFDGRIFSESL